VIIVAGSLDVDPSGREAYLDGCREVVGTARDTPGCLDFALSADLLDPGRINVFERWESAEALRRFRGSGPPEDQLAQLREIRVAEYEVGASG
jgi:quinol monooxygenase YgiN